VQLFFIYFRQGGRVNFMVSDSSKTGILSLIPDSKIGVMGTLGLACIIGSYFVGFL